MGYTVSTKKLYSLYFGHNFLKSSPNSKSKVSLENSYSLYFGHNFLKSSPNLVVLKTAGSENFKTDLTFDIWPSRS